jgi:hypothetical protein
MDARLAQHDANVRGTETVIVSSDPDARGWVLGHWLSLRDASLAIISGEELSASHCRSLLTRVILDAPEI